MSNDYKCNIGWQAIELCYTPIMCVWMIIMFC